MHGEYRLNDSYTFAEFTLFNEREDEAQRKRDAMTKHTDEQLHKMSINDWRRLMTKHTHIGILRHLFVTPTSRSKTTERAERRVKIERLWRAFILMTLRLKKNGTKKQTGRTERGKSFRSALAQWGHFKADGRAAPKQKTTPRPLQAARKVCRRW